MYACIYATYWKKIENWPSVKYRDVRAYCQFFSFFNKCDGVGNGNTMNTPDVLCLLISKLPLSVADRWNRKALSFQRNTPGEPYLSGFISLFDEETFLVNDPVFSREVISGYVGKSKKNGQEKRGESKGWKALATEVASHHEDLQEICRMCNSGHDLGKCEEFLKKNWMREANFWQEKKMCYDCYKSISSTCNARTCTMMRI